MRFAHLLLLPLLLTLIAPLSGCRPPPKVVAKAKVAIRTEPAGATVIVNHKIKWTEPTPCLLPLTAGNHVLEIGKPQFRTTWRNVVCQPGEELALDLVLEPVSAAILLESKPPGATIIVADQPIGQTPFLLDNQPVGEHTAILKLPGYAPLQVAWQVEDERPQLVVAELISNTGSVSITSIPPGANVLVAGQVLGQTPVVLFMEQGGQRLRLEAAGYAPHEQEVSVMRDRTVEVTATLQLLPAVLKVTSVPTDAALFINGQQHENTPTAVVNLVPGIYDLRVAKEGFDDATRQVNLAPGQEIEVTMVLDSNLGGIDLIANPPGVTVYVDGRKVGITQAGETAELAAVMEIRGLASGEHRITLAHKRAKPSPEINFKATVLKGEITRPKPLRMWVADHHLRLKNGVVLIGRVRQENAAEVLFEHNPQIVQRYARDEIESIRPLDPDE